MENNNENFPDKRFCKIALDSLKTYKNKDFTNNFMDLHGIEKANNLKDNWKIVEAWLDNIDISRCMKLLKYTDNLRKWGRQRIFLFDIGKNEIERKTHLKNLSNPDFIREKVGTILDNAFYRWDAHEPLLVDVYYENHNKSNPKNLILKFIETREYEVVKNMTVNILEKRSTNFFIINLEKGFAQLILEKLPKGAKKGINEEHRLFEEAISKYFNFNIFSQIKLGKVMVEMLRSPIYPILYTGFKAGIQNLKNESTLVVILNHLFIKPIPRQIRAYWECKQNIIARPHLNFNLNGNNGCITIDGVADPNRIQDILKIFIDISRGLVQHESNLIVRGLMQRTYKNLWDKPKAQAVVLASGAVAATIIWMLIEGIGNYIFEEEINEILNGFPLVFITISIEILWISLYYGLKRVKRSFSALLKMKPGKIIKAIIKAKKAAKLQANKLKKPSIKMKLKKLLNRLNKPITNKKH